MSQQFQPAPSGLTPDRTPDVLAEERARVDALISAHNSVRALDVAKDIHKRLHTAASEALLLDAYAARATSLIDRNLHRDANALMEMVRERYPAARERFRRGDTLNAHAGNLNVLLAPLNNPSLPPEKLAAISLQIRREVYDLRGLAECAVLPLEHPLRIAAAALHQTFVSVTSGPVAEEALALPQVPRSSPLAPWKMLVRGIAAYYRREDELCERCVAAIEPDSAAARLAPALHALLHRSRDLPPAVTALVNRVGADYDRLRSILKRLDSAFAARNKPQILQEIRAAVAACAEIKPDLLPRVKQHISIRAKDGAIKVDQVASALGGHSLKNAYFWRLLSRSYEEEKEPMATACACATWEEFRKHAVREGWFPAKGPEVAAIYLHMADNLHRSGPTNLNEIIGSFSSAYHKIMAAYYFDQPAEIHSLMPDRGNTDFYFLSPYSLLERASEADPCSDNFHRWMRFTQDGWPTKCDHVAERWTAALPNDIPPLLHLMQSAEKRNALQKAFKLMERAEQIDGLNAEVRRARLRLLVSMIVRHLRAGKPHLAEKELRQIEALPQARQGDGPAFIAALRNAVLSPGTLSPAFEEAVRVLEDEVAAHLLFLQVEHLCGLPYSPLRKPSQKLQPLFLAFGRASAIADDFGIPSTIVPAMVEQMLKELSDRKVSASPRILSSLGEAAMRQNALPLAYAVAGVGLAQSADTHARFLLLRARALPPWEQDRRTACLAAASELARRQHDAGLLKQIGEVRNESFDWLDAPDSARSTIDNEEIGRIVQQEIKARAFPAEPSDELDDPDFLDGDDFLDEENYPFPDRRAAGGEMPFDPSLGLPPDLAKVLPKEMLDLVKQLGPEAVANILGEMLGFNKKKKRRRKGSRDDDFDLLF